LVILKPFRAPITGALFPHEAKMLFRSYTWGAANISWSVVMEELLRAAEDMGHTTHLISTNGTQGMLYWNEQKLLQSMQAERELQRRNIPYDIDITFTVPRNFPQRFLNNSKVKMAIYDYESSIMPKEWKNFYHLVDFVLPGSQYVAEMFKRNGCPEEKIKVVHHGVDLNVFNPSIEPLSLPTQKGFKFLCIGEPHYRKQIDKLLQVYCNTFTSDDDVTLILKTKIFNTGDTRKVFEMDLRPVLAELKSKMGNKMPEIKIIQKRFDNIASLYTACDAFVLMTASEGWGMPYLEALACNLPVIAPRHGGQLDFLNDDNAILCDTGTRKARDQEQYWGRSPGAVVGSPDEGHYSQLMREMYENHTEIKNRLRPHMENTVKDFTWAKAVEKIINIAKTTGRI